MPHDAQPLSPTARKVAEAGPRYTACPRCITVILVARSLCEYYVLVSAEVHVFSKA